MKSLILLMLLSMLIGCGDDSTGSTTYHMCRNDGIPVKCISITDDQLSEMYQNAYDKKNENSSNTIEPTCREIDDEIQLKENKLDEVKPDGKIEGTKTVDIEKIKCGFKSNLTDGSDQSYYLF